MRLGEEPLFTVSQKMGSLNGRSFENQVWPTGADSGLEKAEFDDRELQDTLFKKHSQRVPDEADCLDLVTCLG